MATFLRINRADPVPRNVRSDAKIVLILINPDGTASPATGARDKDDVVRAWKADGGMLAMVWPGQWKTESYLLDAEDLDLIYRTER